MTMMQRSVRSPKGYLMVTDPEMPTIETETLQCCHCGAHWQVQPGSGIERGFCYRCQAVHCGGPSCWECKPQEAVLEELEAMERLQGLVREAEAHAAFGRQMERLKGR